MKGCFRLEEWGGRKCDPRVLSQPSAKPVEGCLPYKISGFEKNHLLSVSSSFLPGPHSTIIPSAYAQVFLDLQNQEISQQRTLFNFLNENFSSFLSLGYLFPKYYQLVSRKLYPGVHTLFLHQFFKNQILFLCCL